MTSQPMSPTDQDTTITPREPVLLDLAFRNNRGGKCVFQVKLHFDGLAQLLNDALHGLRVYDLMMIRRPGDIWNYVWVEKLNIPESVEKRHQLDGWRVRRSGQFDLFTEFDGLFSHSDGNKTPEDECWLRARGKRPFAGLADELFSDVRNVQSKVRSKRDLLTRYVLAAMGARKHFYDFLPAPPTICTMPGYKPIYTPKHKPGYYRQLYALLRSPKLTSIGFARDDDFVANRLACLEQLRRSCQPNDQEKRWLSITMSSSGREYFREWGAAVRCHDESIGDAQLYVVPTAAVKVFITWITPPPLCFTDEDAGEFEGYTKLLREDCCIYLRKPREAKQAEETQA